MHYYVSAYRESGHPDGHMLADRKPFKTLDDAFAWIYENAFVPKTTHSGLHGTVDLAPATYEPGVHFFQYEVPTEYNQRSTSDYERLKKLFDKQFTRLNGINCVQIEREDRAMGAAHEEFFEGNRPKSLKVIK